MSDSALNIWKHKLEFLQIELAKAVDPDAKFKLHKGIQEAEAEIAKRSGSDTPKSSRKIAGTYLDKHAPKKLFGREAELAALDAAWANETLNVYTLVAWGGAGKTSLVFHWVQTRFAAKGWPGVERYFDWSFYSQGTGESRQTYADLFIAKALEFFGDPDPTQGGPHERGGRLAGLIRQHRTVLILDGIEPLQYPPNDPQAGRLKDPALEALLRELAADNPGLVVITTREHLTNVEGHATTKEQKLDKLAKEAAVSLLRHLQIVGTDEELHAAWQDAGGHALTLSLLGRFIADAYEDRDIRHYREVKFEAADQEHQGRSAFKVMIAYERWLQSGGPERQRELAVLRLTGLFDRPMAKSCLQALRAEPSIPGLTEALVKLTSQQWNIAVKRLSDVELLSVSSDAIDAHPLIREYFAVQLKRDQPEAFRAAHSRLFDYLCQTTPYRPDGLDGLAPLYEAVAHGCLAGRHQEARENVYRDRILRGTGYDGYYSSKKLGAFGADLAAVAAFFDEPWREVSPNLTADAKAWLLNEAATRLEAIGRMTEALQPMCASLEHFVRERDWGFAAIIAMNLSSLKMTIGRLSAAVTDAFQSITHADLSNDPIRRKHTRATAANALFQSGQRTEAGTLFAVAERIQQETQPQIDTLYSWHGFQYCDWLLAPAEQAAWRRFFKSETSNLESEISDALAEVERRAQKAQIIAINNQWLLDIALDHLTLARVWLLRSFLEEDATTPQPKLDLPHVAAACNGLRAAGQMDTLPCGLLTAALYHFVRGEHALAEKHLAEAQQIAERGHISLYLADIHLTRARLFRNREELTKAAKLIRELGYGRRYGELADAEVALRSLQDSEHERNNTITRKSLLDSKLISSQAEGKPTMATPPTTNQGKTMTRCKVLFLASVPLDSDPLELDEEARAIEQRILQTAHRDAIDFVPKFAVRRDDLQLHLNKEGPHVLHFSGHGTKDEIAFKGDDGNAVPVSKTALKAILKAVKDNIRLVILNACYTGKTADSITDVIDCAIGMKRGISDEAARVFAASFYLAVGFGRSVQNAFDQAVASLQVMGIPENKIPVLIWRDGVDPNALFLVQATDKQPNPL